MNIDPRKKPDSNPKPNPHDPDVIPVEEPGKEDPIENPQDPNVDPTPRPDRERKIRA